MIHKFDKFVNEAKKATKDTDKYDDNDKFNDMLFDIEEEFKKDPLKVTKAFNRSAQDLFDGEFICSKELDYADEDMIKKVYNNLKNKNKK